MIFAGDYGGHRVIVQRESAGDDTTRLTAEPRAILNLYLDAVARISTSDGESRLIGVGDVLLVEDTTGKGHRSKGLGKIRHSLFIAVD